MLVEGTRLSEGRGTTRPFELIGAPWIDGDRLADAMNDRGLPGVHFRAAFFEPTFQKHARQSCGGCQIHVLDRSSFQPLRTTVELLDEFRKQDPARFAWREPPYEYEHEKQPIDILYGSDRLRRTLDENGSVTALVDSWRADEERFRRQRQPHLLYYGGCRARLRFDSGDVHPRVFAIPGARVSCFVAGTMWYLSR